MNINSFKFKEDFMCINSNMSIIPYTRPMTAMEFINSEVEKQLSSTRACMPFPNSESIDSQQVENQTNKKITPQIAELSEIILEATKAAQAALNKIKPREKTREEQFHEMVQMEWLKYT